MKRVKSLLPLLLSLVCTGCHYSVDKSFYGINEWDLALFIIIIFVVVGWIGEGDDDL